MSMPEAPMNENDGSEPGKYQVRGSRKIPIMQTISQTNSVQRPTKLHFRFSIPLTH